MKNKKLYSNAKEALFDIQSNTSIMSGGFGLCGIAENCINELAKKNINNLTVISNNIGNAGKGLAILLKQKKISKAICSYVGGNPDLEELILNKEIEITLCPQGSFAEKLEQEGLELERSTHQQDTAL